MKFLDMTHAFDTEEMAAQKTNKSKYTCHKQASIADSSHDNTRKKGQALFAWHQDLSFSRRKQTRRRSREQQRLLSSKPLCLHYQCAGKKSRIGSFGQKGDRKFLGAVCFWQRHY